MTSANEPNANANALTFVIATICVALVVGFSVYAYQTEKKRVLESGVERIRLETAQYAADVANRLATLGLVVSATSKHITQAARGQNAAPLTGSLRPYLVDVTRELSALRTVVIINPQGIITDDLRENQPGRGIDVSDREYFRMHDVGNVNGTFVSEPVVSRVDGKWTWTLTAAARDDSGELLAVVLASVDSRYFHDIFRLTAPAQQLRSLLLHSNGTVLEASGQSDLTSGSKIQNLSLMETAMREVAFVSTSIEGPTGRTGLIVAAQIVEGWPAVVVNLLSRQEFDKELTGFFWLSVLAAGLISVMIASAAALSIRMNSLRAASEAAIRESEQRFRSAFENTALGNVVFNKDGLIQMFNATAEKIFGYSADEIVGSKAERLLPDAGDGSFDNFISKFMVRSDTGFSGVAAETTAVRKDGEGFPVSLIASEMTRMDGGAVIGSVTDITELKSLQEQLLHAQRLDAIGQLTGGIAHDFNNILAVVMGNAELLAEEAEGSAQSKAFAEAVIRSSEKGSNLVQRLLAFSRRQVLKPQVVDVGELVRSLLGLLAPTLGETIEVTTRIQPGVWNAFADPSQLETALLNLAINAQHAMPDGGEVTIECANHHLENPPVEDDIDISAGDYVILSVIDQGTGMPDDVAARAFEPFFTTKEVGQGSGLGLSMVHGFARQSGGIAKITSEAGMGTTVSIFLPRAHSGREMERTAAAEQVTPGNGEKIMVIEDDPDVRELIVSMLTSLRYTVISVPDAASARAELLERPSISLILTDVVLPGGTSGPQFADEILSDHPDLRVLFMSGYPAHFAGPHDSAKSDKHILRKPFRVEQLSEALRTALE